jgi:anti-anti-sigma regulatory factor
MTSKTSARIRSGNGYSFLQLGGVVDEDNNLRSLTPRLEAETLILDLSEVNRINSCGVRDWVNWLGDLHAHGKRAVMIRCAPAIVAQANMVTNFLGDALILSFFAPYYCPSCDRSEDKLLHTQQFAGMQEVTAPHFPCETCGQALEFDDFEESYFAFVQAMDLSQLDAELAATVERATPGLEQKLRQLDAGRETQLSGPVHTLSRPGTTPVSRPNTEDKAFPGLIASASDVAKVHSGPVLTRQSQVAPTRSSRTSILSAASIITFILIAISTVVVVVLTYLVLTIK